MKKRFWACFLSLSLVLTMMPTMAFAADDEVNEPEGTVEVCVKTEGCTLEAGHKGECVVVESEPEEPESVPCKVTEGCTLENGHEGECVVGESEPEEPESTPCKVTEGCTLENGHEGECVVVESKPEEQESVLCKVTEGCTLEDGHEGECAVASNQTDDNTDGLLNNIESVEFTTLKSEDDIIENNAEIDLQMQIEEADGTKNNPTVIEIAEPIALTTTLVIPDGKYIELVGVGENITIFPAEGFQSTSFTSALIEVGNTETNEALLNLKNVTLDCRELTRGIAIHRAQYLNLDNTVIKNGRTGSGSSGGGIMVSWTSGNGGPYINISNTEIFNCHAGIIGNGKGKYGGAINMYGSGKLTLADVNFHDNAADWGGSSIYSSNIELSGAVIIGKNESGRTGIFSSSIKVTDSLDEDSEIWLSCNLGGVANFDTVFDITGTDQYQLTQSDFEKFILGNATDYSGVVTDHYVLYLDEDNNAIKLAEANQIYLNANYGDNPETKLYKVVKGQNAILPENPFKRTGYKLTGWNTNSDGIGDPFTNGAELDNALFSDGLTLYAQWEKCVHASENYKYTAEENTLTQICEDCNTALGSIAIFAPSDDLCYDGQMKNALVKTASWKGDVPSIVYTQDDVEVMPINAGDYTASITMEEAVASVDFTIKKAKINLAITPSSAEISGGGKVILSIVGVPDEGEVSVTCNNENIEVTENADDTYTVTLPNETAEYTFTATYEGDHNHEAAQDTCTVSVTRHTGGGGASHPEAGDNSSSDRNDRDDDNTENIDEEDVPLTEGKVADFDDVPADAWFAEAVQYVYEHDLMTGVSENLFAPNAQMNRAMVAQILFNMEQPTDTQAPAAFRDVAADQWYAKAVNWAVWQGYMSGYDASSFGPNDALTREQLVTVLWRYSGSPVMDNSSMLNTFSDAALTSDYAQQAMIWAYAQGVISGNADGTLNPQGTATRAEIAQMLMNYCENVK